MKDQEIRSVVIKALKQIAPEFDYDTLAPDENVRATVDIDSFDYLNLFIGISEALGVEVPESDYGRLVTLNDIIGYLSERIE